jgi:hypothetical protein
MISNEMLTAGEEVIVYKTDNRLIIQKLHIDSQQKPRITYKTDNKFITYINYTIHDIERGYYAINERESDEDKLVFNLNLRCVVPKKYSFDRPTPS